MKFGVIGCSVGINHIESYIRKGHEVSAICDISKERAFDTAKKYNIEKVLFEEDSYKEMLDLDLDGISICTPPYIRKNILIDCIKSGKNILVEKPLASKLEDAKEIVDVASKYDKTYAMCYNWRNTFVMLLLKGFVKNPLYNIKSLNVYHEFGFDYSKNASWREDPDMGGGHIIELDIHVINYIRYILGDVSAVHASGNKNPINPKIYQNIDVSLEHQNEKTTKCILRHGTGIPLHQYFNFDLKAEFDRGTYWAYSNWEPKNLGIDYPIFQIFFGDKEIMSYEFTEYPRDKGLLVFPQFSHLRYNLQNIWDNLSWDKIITDFTDCIKSKRKPESTLIDGYEDLKVAFAIRKSLEEGRKIKIDT